MRQGLDSMEEQAGSAPMADESPKAKSKDLFLDILRLIERLHRRMLDVVRNKLEEETRGELNPVQAMLIFNIGENETTAGELRSRGYYLGS
ncbi:MAG: hypothetical protein V3R73_07925, partial [Sphingomonadales bacterium]